MPGLPLLPHCRTQDAISASGQQAGQRCSPQRHPRTHKAGKRNVGGLSSLDRDGYPVQNRSFATLRQKTKFMQAVVTTNVFSPNIADNSTQQTLAKYCEKLRKADGQALGFIPFSGFQAAMIRNRMIIEIENGEPCGFLIWSRTTNRLKILMIAIQPDARRIFHATNLISGMLTLKAADGAEFIQLRCADDLESNQFWKGCGFNLITQVDGGKLRSAVVKPKTGTIEEQIVRALGKKTLMKIKRKTCIYRRINVYRLWIERSPLWAGRQELIKVDSFTSVVG